MIVSSPRRGADRRSASLPSAGSATCSAWCPCRRLGATAEQGCSPPERRRPSAKRSNASAAADAFLASRSAHHFLFDGRLAHDFLFDGSPAHEVSHSTQLPSSFVATEPGADIDQEEGDDPNLSAEDHPPPFQVWAPYPTGDWGLEDRDGGACKAYDKDYSDMAHPPGVVPSLEGQVGYGGELQLLEEYRTPSLLFSDLTNTRLWTCPFARKEENDSYEHPQLEFRYPHHKVHVHLEDKSGQAGGRVLWDAEYDMGGTEYLKSTAKPIAGSKQIFEPICPPTNGPPHWYELTVSLQGRRPSHPHMMQDFIGAQVLTAFRPDHDPELTAFRSLPGSGGGACTVM